MSTKELALKLSRCEKETEVIELLKAENLWDDPSHWHPFGDNDNNFSTIGNQQSAPDAALVEKLVNSIDAMLMKECQIRQIDPKSNSAPQSINEAICKFYEIKDGQLANLPSNKRTELAKKGIYLAATGDHKKPCISIIDSGEGQSPESLPHTILSLNKDNKLKVKFVQGKFNMGGTGVLQFCGYHNFQLIISKRCPQILKEGESSDWCFTLVRRESENEGRKSSRYTYLVDKEDKVFHFNEEALDLIPYRDNKYEPLNFGMYNKLFEYNIPRYNSRIVPGNLYYRISTLLPVLAYPIRFNECRDRFKNVHGLEQTLNGLSVRLSEDKNNNIEKDFGPQSMTFTIDGATMTASIYVFKRGVETKQYKDDEGVIFMINGQTHGSISKNIFKQARLDYLLDSILILIDCSDLDTRIREDLFMNSRDRLRKSEVQAKIEQEIIEELRGNESLLRLLDKRRQEAIAERVKEDKPLQEILNNLMKRSPTLSKLFLHGLKLSNPVSTIPVEDEKDFIGKKSPSYFVINEQKEGIVFEKHAHINNKFRIKFKTDVENEWLSREESRGTYKLLANNMPVLENRSMSLNNGTANLTIALPESAHIGQEITYTLTVQDDYMPQPITNTFKVIVEKAIENDGGGTGKRVSPPSNKSGKGNFNHSNLALPNTIPVYREKWAEYGFDENTALVVRAAEENSYDFFINMNNKCLDTEIKPYLKNEARVNLLRSKYKYGMILIGLAILNEKQSKKTDNSSGVEEKNDETESVECITRMLAPVLLPIIESLGSLNSDEVLN